MPLTQRYMNMLAARCFCFPRSSGPSLSRFSPQSAIQTLVYHEVLLWERRAAALGSVCLLSVCVLVLRVCYFPIWWILLENYLTSFIVMTKVSCPACSRTRTSASSSEILQMSLQASSSPATVWALLLDA